MALDGKSVVLLGENDRQINDLLSGALKLQGLLVYSAYSTREYIEKLEQLKAAVDLVCINGIFASERGGFLVTKTKELAGNNSKIIVVTDTPQDDKANILRYGVDDLVNKPISTESIASKVMSLLPPRE